MISRWLPAHPSDIPGGMTHTEEMKGWIDVGFHALRQLLLLATSVPAELWVILLPIPFAVLRGAARAWAVWTNGDGDKAEAAVSRAGLIGATKYASVLRDLLAQAALPESPGGTAVTEQERLDAARAALREGFGAAATPEDLARALAVTVDAAVARMKKAGELRNAVKYYGDEELVRDSIRAKVLAKAEVPVDPAPTVTTERTVRNGELSITTKTTEPAPAAPSDPAAP